MQKLRILFVIKTNSFITVGRKLGSEKAKDIKVLCGA